MNSYTIRIPVVKNLIDHWPSNNQNINNVRNKDEGNCKTLKLIFSSVSDIFSRY